MIDWHMAANVTRLRPCSFWYSWVSSYTSKSALGKCENLALAEFRVEPQKRQIRKLFRQKVAAYSDFTDQNAVFREMPGGLVPSVIVS